MEAKAISYTIDSKGNTINKHLKDVANTVHQSTGSGGNTDCLVLEPTCVAMRGRNPDNPSEDYAEIIGNIHDNPELLKTE